MVAHVKAASYNTAWDVLSTRPELSAFKDLVQQSNQTSVWQTTQYFTAFAPNNTAMASFTSKYASVAQSNFPDAWLKLVRYHMKNESSGPGCSFAANNSIEKVQVTSVAAGNALNGCVYILGDVLQYWYNTVADALNSNANLTTFTAAVEDSSTLDNAFARLQTAASPSLATLFAPTNQAYVILNQQANGYEQDNMTLTYHLVENSTLRTDGTSRITALNGKELYVNSSQVNGERLYTPISMMPQKSGSVGANVLTMDSVDVGFGPQVSIYAIDQVLLTCPLFPLQNFIRSESSGAHSDYYAAIQQVADGAVLKLLNSGSTSTVTWFRPDNQAFAGFVQAATGYSSWSDAVANGQTDALSNLLKATIATTTVNVVRGDGTDTWIDTLLGAKTLRLYTAKTLMASPAAILQASGAPFLAALDISSSGTLSTGCSWFINPREVKPATPSQLQDLLNSRKDNGGGSGGASAVTPSLFLTTALAVAAARWLVRA